MAMQTRALHTAPMSSRDEVTVAYLDGIKAGLVGALTIAVWFGVLDVLWGRPLYTPTVLGTALFRGGVGLDNPATLEPSAELVLGFTWIHMLAFLLVGMAAGRLLLFAEHDSHLGFGIVLFFCVFEVGFLWACMMFAEPVLQALAWPAIVAGNLLAAMAKAATLRRRHRTLAIEP
jgi:hypothetical protein